MKLPCAKEKFFTRREFFGLAAMSAAWLGMEKSALLGAADTGLKIELGVCRSFSEHAFIKSSGFQYIEESVSHVLMPKASDSEFEKRWEEIKGCSLPVRACSGFIPGDMKLVGPVVDLEALLRHAETVFRRAERVGITRIVFGSGDARRIPVGFDPAQARDQFIMFCRKAAPIAQAHKVIVVLEALNRGETNFINRVDEGLGIVDAVGHPGFQMHADIYHMRRENEGPESIVKAGARLKHCHVAEVKRRASTWR